ncbi:MAG: hypothetical protein PHD03_00675 [Bacilli bacterium]|nr:hypothetical protein [Bacilli bacterium]MDD4406763.1 hypothetical protein [Bacilli bacterium]
MDKLSPIIEENKIINLNEIIDLIKQINDEELINDYLNEIEEYNDNSFDKIDGLDIINDSLTLRLNEIQVKEINEPEELLISENEFKRILDMLYNGKEISKENTNDLFALADILLSEMDKGSLNSDKQNALDIFIYYLKVKLENSGLNNKENKFLNKYVNIVAKKQADLEKEHHKEDIRIKALKFKEKQDSTRGAIITIVVLEVTTLLGILISVLALANN